ncbi:hypothetical protein DER46DRAFT_624855 [Fusarium sp. MPI-SDFR-AT-0072]|uniref:LysM domain-containing protein n=1 Tax=Fusarium oxysporum f. sp. rapae TaxID=485398 RepID=A0A8J5PA47_FUSOX|nr:LysM domain-containing protein [Fusarium oxysporum f. sp. rapae]KAH7166780.1 hypothetical protein DER46DRAFT_624855 [Fusarium sp. MPI-SDFR-AT-0072]KAI7771756.1 hypothetical protein LZL87_006032 [Fusarium oxysporum]
MHLVALLAASLVLRLPYALAMPSRRAVKCDYETYPLPGQTCSTFAKDWSMTVDELKSLNPGLTCPRLDPVGNYCVDGTADKDEPTGVVSKTTKPTSAPEPSPDKMPDAPSDAESVSKPHSDAKSTAKPTVPQKPSPADEYSGHGIQTPHPIQEGMVANCNKFHYVTPTTTCQGVLAYHKISLADFIEWNPAVGKDCTNLWKGTNACVCVNGYTSSPTTNTKPNPVGITSDNGFTTPSPIQAGLVKNCVKFHYIGAGTTCHSVLHHYKITMAQFAQWNPAVGEDCTNLWKDTYACVAAV